MKTETSSLAGLFRELTRGVQKTASLSLFLPLQPVPASRPRVGRWGTYYAPTYKKWKALAEEMIEDSDIEIAGHCFVIVRSVVKPAKTTKLLQPKPDVDNYVKGPLDAITKAEGYWFDDHQITALLVHKRFAEPEEIEGTHVDIFEYS